MFAYSVFTVDDSSRDPDGENALTLNYERSMGNAPAFVLRQFFDATFEIDVECERGRLEI
jgi:hypothetical protein